MGMPGNCWIKYHFKQQHNKTETRMFKIRLFFHRICAKKNEKIPDLKYFGFNVYIYLCYIVFYWFNQEHNQISRTNELQWTNKTHFFIKISLSFYSRKGHTVYVSLREKDEETYTQRGDIFLPHIFFLASRIVRDDLTPLIGCVSLARLPILTGL